MILKQRKNNMTDLELKKLKDNLWHSADILRSGAHIAANKYGQPILGLIFLRYADILYKQHKKEIDKEYYAKKGGRAERSYKEICIEKCGFYLPEKAYFDFINDSPDTSEKAILVKEAMEAIENENPRLQGVLPKEVYGQLVPEEEPELLSRVVRIFKDIPETIDVDLFGEIYEFFLGEFAIQEGKDGGTFYTPATVVRYMVEVIKPEAGEKMFLDPACGSGGMFVQAARYMHRHNKTADRMQFRCYGVEKEPDTVKLAKMNLLLNNVRGEITEANSFYSNPYDAVGKFDYVMANPPFNVNEVLYERVKDDDRFKAYGMTKGTKGKGKDAKGTVSNANYLWISYFATALNEKGKAALVMANVASDSSGNDAEIRKKLIKTGTIKQMVAMPTNMFNSVTLPSTLWFFDKTRPESQKDEVLFINAKNIFTQVDRGHRKFSDEQIKNLTIISRLYEGDTESFDKLIKSYKEYASYKELEEYYNSQIEWLYERFPDGKYHDVIGLCKVVKIGEIFDSNGNVVDIEEDSIADQDWSLNPLRYVGVSFKDDEISFEDFLKKNDEIHRDIKLNQAKIDSIFDSIFSKSSEILLKAEQKNKDQWHIGKVEELGKFVRGKNITSAEMIDGEIPVISAGLEPSGYHNKTNVSGPSITISSSGANAGVVLLHMNDIWAADCSYVNSSDYIFYLYDLLHYIQPVITNLQRGSAQPHVYAKDINRIKIVIPPKDVLFEINELLKALHETEDLIKTQLKKNQEETDFVLKKLLSKNI